MPIPDANQERSYRGRYMQAGEEAEEIVFQWLLKQPYVVELKDLRGSKPVQDTDIDAAIFLRDGRTVLAEIKSDRHLGVSDNILFEVLRIQHTAEPVRCAVLGWSVRSPAQWLIYYAPSVNKIYQVSFEDLRKVFQAYTRAERDKVKTIWVNTDNIKSTLNVLIPWSWCKEIFKVHDLS